MTIGHGRPWRLLRLALTLLPVALLAAACGPGAVQNPQPQPSARAAKTLTVAGIPDQETSILVRRFQGVAEYLSQRLGVKAKYLPTVDYAAVVTGFKRGDIHLAWFGGLTGVQARYQTPGAEAIAQRPQDAEFHSLFIASPAAGITSLSDLKGKSFTFGSESSTSGHLMPRFFLSEAGISPDRDMSGPPGYSGSHDKTWKLVETGAYQAGALNEDVWKRAVRDGLVDTTKVSAFYTTPSYFDYHWLVRPDLDKEFGDGFSQSLREALLEMGGEQQEILSVFDTERFIATDNANYEALAAVATTLGILQQ